MTVRKQRSFGSGKSVAAWRSTPALVEELDRRTLLSVSFTFNIIDPTNKYASIKSQLQAQLNAAGAEWSTHLVGNAALQYDVAFTNAVPPLPSFTSVRLAQGAVKSAQVVRTDTVTGKTV